MWSLFWNYEAYFEFHRKSVRGINKDKRELGLVLMTLNIRKVPAQRAENYKNHKRQFYIISIEIVFIYLSWNFMFRTLPTISQVLIIKISIT